METLCSRFYAFICRTTCDIDMGFSGECLDSKIWQFIFLDSMTFFVTFTFDLEETHNYLIFLVLLNRNGPAIFQKTTRRPILWSFAFPLSTMGGTQVDDLLDVESQKHFTAISILSYLVSLCSGMPIWWVVIEISSQNLLLRVSILTVGDRMTWNGYSLCWRWWKCVGYSTSLLEKTKWCQTRSL